VSGPFELHLLRHGRPEGAGRLIGHTDAAPLAEGIVLCRARAAGLSVEAVVGSDLARAQIAAEAIATDKSLPCTLDARWREIDFGQWENVLPANLPPGALEGLHDDPDGHAPPGGERWSDLRARIAAALDDIGRDTLVVTHAGAIRAALAVLLGLEYRHTPGFLLPYGALVSLRLWPGETRFAQITGLRG
jgi:alpha-ribazole phosphatase